LTCPGLTALTDIQSTKRDLGRVGSLDNLVIKRKKVKAGKKKTTAHANGETAATMGRKYRGGGDTKGFRGGGEGANDAPSRGQGRCGHKQSVFYLEKPIRWVCTMSLRKNRGTGGEGKEL